MHVHVHVHVHLHVHVNEIGQGDASRGSERAPIAVGYDFYVLRIQISVTL